MGPGGLRAAALVISECQAGILDLAASTTPGLAARAAECGIVDRIAELAMAFREAGLPVVHCHIEHRPDMAGVRRNSLLGANRKIFVCHVAGNDLKCVESASAP